MNNIIKGLGGVVAVLGVAVACTSIAGTDTARSAQNNYGSTPTESHANHIPISPVKIAPQTPTGPRTAFGEGVWEVNVDIEPGKYKTQGPIGSGSCYYFRMKENQEDYLGSGSSDGPVTVVIKETDGYFKTQGCEWKIAG